MLIKQNSELAGIGEQWQASYNGLPSFIVSKAIEKNNILKYGYNAIFSAVIQYNTAYVQM